MDDLRDNLINHTTTVIKRAAMIDANDNATVDIMRVRRILFDFRAEALKLAAERGIAHIKSLGTVYSGTDHYIAVDPYDFEDGLRDAILSDKQEAPK